MTERELLEKIIQNQEDMRSDMETIKSDMKTMKSDMDLMKSDMKTMKSDMDLMKSDIKDIRSDISSLKEKTAQIELHLENVTDKNITLLAENYITLIRKLNENNKVTDAQLAYQVKVDYLSEEVEILKRDVKELKTHIA